MTDRSNGNVASAEVIRDGQHVHLVMTCASDYDAMMLYDRLCEEMKAGYVQLELECRPKAGARR